jgi:tRNA nucleotidyltransferase/poly(A) polymerase
MTLKEMLTTLYEVGKLQDTIPLIVGGLPRDRVAGQLAKMNDVDICTGYDTQILAKEFSIQLGKKIPVSTKQGADGHFSIHTPELKIDFSSNFNVPGIDQILKAKGIANPTAMQREVYSRDFFCNTLLMSLDFRKIKDLTGEGISDIKNKRIRTCLTPELTFKDNVKRIIRVVYLACKLGFEVDPQIIEWVRKNPQYTAQAGSEYLAKNITNAMRYDKEKAVALINAMNLWKHIPISKSLYPYYTKYALREGISV